MNAFRVVGIVAWNTFQDNLRSRFHLICVVFGVVALYVSLLLGLLAADQELRVLLDFGLALIEILGLAAGLYGAATTILRELETKTIYLILTRPVSRGQYLLGRFAGLMCSVGLAMAVMAFFHIVIMLFKGWSWSGLYFAALAGSFLKILAACSLTLFLALFSSSILTAMVISLVLWTLGHFLPEIRFMIRWGSAKPAMLPLTALSYIVPDLQLLNMRDRMTSASGLLTSLLYAAGYAGAWLAMSIWRLKRKEF